MFSLSRSPWIRVWVSSSPTPVYDGAVRRSGRAAGVNPSCTLPREPLEEAFVSCPDSTFIASRVHIPAHATDELSSVLAGVAPAFGKRVTAKCAANV